MELLKKISVKTVCGTVDIRELQDDVELPLMRIVGIANKMKTGTSEYGDYVSFLGNFRATDLRKNVQFASGKCFLPDQASELLEGQFVEGANGIEFGFDIGVIYDDSVGVKYRYTIKPLIKPTESDPIALLEHRLSK